MRSLVAVTALFAAVPLALQAAGATAERQQKAGMKDKHPADPQAVSPAKSALTEEVSRLLAPRKYIEAKPRNYIDDFVFKKMERDHVLKAGLASDQEFLRRISLDLTGRIPKPD